MAMNEVVVIDEVNDDLEEGEIADDIEVFNQPVEKPKQLPRRYTLYHNGSNKRHKNCKQKEKSNFLSLSKSEAIHKKKHKSSCPRHSSENYRSRHKESHHNNNSTAIKSAFKNYSSPPRAPPLPRKINSNHQNSENEDNFPKLLLDYKKAKERLTPKIEKARTNQDNSGKNETAINNSEKPNNSVRQEISKALPLVDLPEKQTGEASDEEDVEELRRIALATRAKKQLSKVDDNNLNGLSKLDSNNLPSSFDQVSINHLVETFPECDNDSRDNYEVVDMDLDEEENSCQIINDDSLYVIDKMPAITEFSSNLIDDQLRQNIPTNNLPVRNESHLQINNSQAIDDFEEQLLRAEVIASLNKRPKQFNSIRQSPPKERVSVEKPVEEQVEKYVEEQVEKPVEENVSEIVTTVDVIHNVVNTLHNEMKPKPCAIYSKGPLQNSVRQLTKRVIDAKSKFSNLKNNRTNPSPPPPRGVNTIQERLIITLNNDSSTDESEEEANENVASQNVPMSSIEALISSARQKSDAAQLHHVSSANVSCLSKAQQEEYNSLKKLLAEKTQYSVPTKKEKTPSDQSQLNLLLKKISVAKANLEKECGLSSLVEKDLLEKKKNYMTSKLKVQLLKEKLHAAEKIRAANLEHWKQCSAKLDILKKSVSKRESILKMLEIQLSARNTYIESNPIKPPV